MSTAFGSPIDGEDELLMDLGDGVSGPLLSEVIDGKKDSKRSTFSAA